MDAQESQFFELELSLRGTLAEFVRLCGELGFDAKDRIGDLLFDAGIDIQA